MSMPGSFADTMRAGKVIDSGELARVEKLYEEILLETSPNRLAARIAAIYAEALLTVAEKQQQSGEIGEELESLVHDVFNASPELEMLLANPAIHRKRKLEVITKAFDGKCSPLFENFLKLLCKHERLTHLRIISICYQALRDKAAGRQRILIESAVPLEPDQLEKFRSVLAEALRDQPILINRVRPELLGGVLVHIGDKVFDSTVQYRLETLKSQFLARGSHEIQTGRDRFSSYT